MSAERESANRLRRAATHVRLDWPMGMRCPDTCDCNDHLDYHPRADQWNAVADWLDSTARSIETAPGFGIDAEADRLARLIVGEGA